MATSSIFTHVEIADRKKARQFVLAIEKSEKAQSKRQRTPSAVLIAKDADDIRKLMAKRFSAK